MVKNAFATAEDANRRNEFYPWVRMIPWRRQWQPTSVLLPVKCHREWSLGDYSPWGCTGLYMT